MPKSKGQRKATQKGEMAPAPETAKMPPGLPVKITKTGTLHKRKF